MATYLFLPFLFTVDLDPGMADWAEENIIGNLLESAVVAVNLPFGLF